MIKVVYHPGGDARLGDLLQKNLCDPKWQLFRAAVAFVKKSGTKHFCPHLTTFAQTGRVKLSVGIDHQGTSLEALHELLESIGPDGEAYVFHNEARSTFHPKVYLFANEAAAECFIGSGNLTEGGLFTNCEIFIHLGIDRRHPGSSALLGVIEKTLNDWSDPVQATVQRLTPELLKQLHDEGYVPTEAQMQARQTDGHSARRQGSSATTRSNIFGAVRFKPAPKVGSIGRHEQGTRKVATPAARTPSARGFVMTLQRTDVGIGQVTAGTSKRSPEIFIPLAARDSDSQFWGWKSHFRQDRAKPGKWDRIGVRMRIGTEIIEVNMMTWPDKHDFRLRNAALRDAGVVDDILRIEQAPPKSAYDYYAEVIPQGSFDYDKYLAMCSNIVRNSRKRWGYY